MKFLVNDAIETLVMNLSTLLQAKNHYCAVAESCTGGLLAATITQYPGSSHWFDGGIITYSDDAKSKLLGIQHQILKDYGAVSKEIVVAMAEAVLRKTQAALSVAITGIAGPEGGTLLKPVGTVWFAWASKYHSELTLRTLSGSREDIRQQCVFIALQGLIKHSQLI